MLERAGWRSNRSVFHRGAWNRGADLVLRPQPVLSPLCCVEKHEGSLAPSAASVGNGVIVSSRPQLLCAVRQLTPRCSTCVQVCGGWPLCSRGSPWGLPSTRRSAAVPPRTPAPCLGGCGSLRSKVISFCMLSAQKVLPILHLLKLLLVTEELAPGQGPSLLVPLAELSQ